MKEVIRDILKRLSDVTGLAYVSADWGQLTMEQPPVEWPCALVEVTVPAYVTSSVEIQEARAVVSVTLADYINAGISPYMLTEEYEQEMRIYAIIDRVHDVLQGLNTQGYSPLVRASTHKTKAIPGVRAFVVEYETQWTDEAVRAELSPVRPDVEVNVSLKK